MSIPKGVVQWLRRRAIASRRRHLVRNKRFHSFDTAKTIGLVFKLEKEVLPAEVLSIMKFLEKKRATCSAIGYYDEVALPEKLVSTPAVSIFTKEDLNWYGRPVAEAVESFLRQGYDIVIDFCRDTDLFPTQYIVSTVQASMIIGGVLYARCPYDLIIDAQQVSTFEGYVEQMKHYLSIINNPQNVEQQTKSKP